MGRAIEMENNIDALKIKVERLENTMRGMCAKLDELDEAIFDYEEDKTSMERAADAEKVVEEKKEKKDGKKANNKTSSNISKSNDGKNRDSKKQNDTNGDDSK